MVSHKINSIKVELGGVGIPNFCAYLDIRIGDELFICDFCGLISILRDGKEIPNHPHYSEILVKANQKVKFSVQAFGMPIPKDGFISVQSSLIEQVITNKYLVTECRYCHKEVEGIDGPLNKKKYILSILQCAKDF